ncbi:MAG TPA: hypothetical protein VEI02_10955, partial [Planctomycetota bacterium]|nr:hypothetical protein [Planctomycetota bacterium]
MGDRASEARPAGLALKIPPERTLRLGGSVDVAVAIVRDGFEGPVEIQIHGLPGGVTAEHGARVVVPPGSLRTDLTLVAQKDASVSETHRVVVTARGADGVAASAPFRLSVRPADDAAGAEPPVLAHETFDAPAGPATPSMGKDDPVAEASMDGEARDESLVDDAMSAAVRYGEEPAFGAPREVARAVGAGSALYEG